jgi:phosphoglycerate dehydrogenase-like enzyme
VALLLHPEIGKLVFPATVREELSVFAEILEPRGELRRREAARMLGEADGAVTSWKSPRLRAEMAGRADRLRIIAHAAGSVKKFVDAAFFERGVTVVNAAAAIAPSVGEMALALTLAGLRSIIRYDRDVKRGGFVKEAMVAPPDNRGLFGKRVGLIGFGRTAREFARLLEPFRCEIVTYDPYTDPARLESLGARAVPIDELLGTSDVVSLHCAYTPQSHHLLNTQRLARMKDGCLLVNTARGNLIDETALAGELRSGRISAALDVTVVEPLPAGADLSTLPNVVLTPHIAGPTHDRLPELGRSAVNDLRLFFSGQPPDNVVTPEMLATMA